MLFHKELMRLFELSYVYITQYIIKKKGRQLET